MDKLIFRKFSLDIINFFIISSFSITFIIWIIQAVNFLDLVSDDGHSLNVYFYYVSLNLPKIFSKTIIFVFFIESCSVILQVTIFKVSKIIHGKGWRLFRMAPLHHHFELAGKDEETIVKPFSILIT